LKRKEAAVLTVIKACICVALVVGFGSPRASADEMSPEARKNLILEGVALNDKGDYDGAMAKYREVLAANPHDSQALYEMTFTLSAKKDWKPCYETAESALAFAQEYRALLFTSAGNCRDAAGDGDKAIALFEKGRREFPSDRGLAFNLGIAYAGKGENRKAGELFERTVRLAPGYGSAHFRLAQTYENGGMRVPALLGYLYYLSLDSGSERAKAAAEAALQLLRQGGKKDKSGNTTIEIHKPEAGSDLTTLDLVLALSAAADDLDEKKGKTEIELVANQLDLLFDAAGDPKIQDQKDCFACQEYLPFFNDLKKHGLTEPFAYVALASLDLPGTADWLKANSAKIGALGDWAASRKEAGKR
jgi:tetratricopeptide (TPR) repeat protein